MLLLRDSPFGPEVLMTRRAERANFAAGAYVFPGGAIDAADYEAHGLAVHRAQQTDYVLTQAIAAIRESFEELGVLLAWRPDGSMADARDVASLDRLPPDGESFISQCAARGLRLAADQLWHLARWIADPNNPKRFDTAFFVARMPEGQVPVADDTEQFEPVWVRPEQALERHRTGQFFMIFPTIRTLERLSLHGSVDSVLATCVGEGPQTHNATRTGLVAGVETRFTGDDAAYGELLLVSANGETVHCLDWRHDVPVVLLRHVKRLTAQGGANSYLVGDASTGYAVIDPGPGDPVHIERLWQAAGGDVHFIVCTHAHAAQAQGAALLEALCIRKPRILDADSVERLVLQGAGALHTHTLVHVGGRGGLVLEEDGLLFCETQPPEPPPASAAHSASSANSPLQSPPPLHGVEFLLPAHGYVQRLPG